MILNKRVRVLGLMIAGVGLLGFLLGCGSVLQEQKKESSATPVAPSVGKKLDRPQGIYYDFEDIQIPNELKVDIKNTKIFQTTNLVAGVLVLDGYVEVKSLITFFKDSMGRDNWQIKGNFRLPPKTVLLFEKKNKRSVFFIEESMFNTHAEVWLIPTQDGQ
ncbi:MAG: hypothetical protein C0407_11710 [Desulfobacca sp.]|nr:hypothetical protein [Desulfobacca sp.]